jgi:hypothetical protein
MGQYIGWLFELLEQGKDRQEAIEYANKRYSEFYGNENVIRNFSQS